MKRYVITEIKQQQLNFGWPKIKGNDFFGLLTNEIVSYTRVIQNAKQNAKSIEKSEFAG